MNVNRPPTLMVRLQRWSEHRQQMTNVRLISIALACVGITLSGTTIFASTARTTEQETDPQHIRTPAFGVVGVGLRGICAEIEERDTDPRKLTDCASRRLFTEDIDLDYPPSRPRAADILVGSSVLRAGKRAYFQVLGIDERPTYAKCAYSHGGKQYWLSFTDLPGLTICVHSNEGRTGILQAENIVSRGKVIEARLTVWEKP